MTEEKEQIGEVLAADSGDKDVSEKIKSFKEKRQDAEDKVEDEKSREDEESYKSDKQHKVFKEEEKEQVDEMTEEGEEPETEEETEPELDEVETLKARNKALLEQLEKVTSGEPEPESKPESEPEPEVDTEPEPEPDLEPADAETVKFVTEEDMTMLYDDPQKLNDVLNKVYKLGIANARKIREDTLRNVSNLVSKQVSQQTTLSKMVDDFYTRNEDLKPYKSFVGTVANEIQAKNPKMELTELFEETEREVRDRLKLRNKVKKEEEVEEPEKEPNFAKGPSSRVIEKTPTPTQQEIDEIVNL